MPICRLAHVEKRDFLMSTFDLEKIVEPEEDLMFFDISVRTTGLIEPS